MRRIRRGVSPRSALGLMSVFMLLACSDEGEQSQPDTQGDTAGTDIDSDSGDTGSDVGPDASCLPGQFLDDSGQCQPCPQGTWTDDTSAKRCLPKTDCEPGSYVLAEGGASEDRECAPCEEDSTTYEVNQAVCEDLCGVACELCEPGSAQTELGCAECLPGQWCEGGDSPALLCEEGTWDHDRAPATPCVPHLQCQPGTYLAEAGHETLEARCEPCEAETYSDTVNASQCEAMRVCLPHEVEVAPVSPSANRECTTFEWQRRFAGEQAGDIARAVAVDAQGHVYVGGQRMQGGINSAATVRKYSSQGVLLWERLLSNGNGDIAYDLAINDQGVVVVGSMGGTFSDTVTYGREDAFVVQLTPEGEVLWHSQFGTAELDKAVGVAVGSDGSIYVGGASEGLLSGASPTLGNGDGFLRKYNAQGVHQWTRVLGTSTFDEVYDVLVIQGGVSDEIYVTGRTYGAISGVTNLGDSDGFLGKYTVDGSITWIRQFGTPNSDSGNALVAVNAQRICIAGTTGSSLVGVQSIRADLRCYSEQGTLAWSHSLSGTGMVMGSSLVTDGEALWMFGIATQTLNGQTVIGESDMFVYKGSVDAAGGEVSLFGTSSLDVIYQAAWSAVDNALYLVGQTGGSFPAETSEGSGTAFVMKRKP